MFQWVIFFGYCSGERFSTYPTHFFFLCSVSLSLDVNLALWLSHISLLLTFIHTFPTCSPLLFIYLTLNLYSLLFSSALPLSPLIPQAKDSDLALLANIPLALLDSSLCWWISFGVPIALLGLLCPLGAPLSLVPTQGFSDPQSGGLLWPSLGLRVPCFYQRVQSNSKGSLHVNPLATC